MLFALPFAMMMACSNSNTSNDSNQEGDSLQVEENCALAPKVVNYTFEDVQGTIEIAKPITFELATVNFNPQDEWKDECLQNFDKGQNQILVNEIFKAVEQGKLTAYDYMTEEAMSIDSVKALRDKFKAYGVSQVQFVEDWYYDNQSNQMLKKVKELTLGFPLFDPKGEHYGDRAAFKVKFNQN